jgi:DIM1 family U5 snRNP protein
MSELKHLHSAWDVDRFIVLEEEKVVAVRFGRYEYAANEDDAELYEHHLSTLMIDDALTDIAPKVRNFCCVVAVDTAAVPEFNQLYELDNVSDPFALMFFYRNKHIKVDLRTGNNNKVNFPVEADDLVDMIEMVYRGAQKGVGLVQGPKKFAQMAIRR